MSLLMLIYPSLFAICLYAKEFNTNVVITFDLTQKEHLLNGDGSVRVRNEDQ